MEWTNEQLKTTNALDNRPLRHPFTVHESTQTHAAMVECLSGYSMTFTVHGAAEGLRINQIKIKAMLCPEHRNKCVFSTHLPNIPDKEVALYNLNTCVSILLANPENKEQRCECLNLK